jgi:hypothetical protein
VAALCRYTDLELQLLDWTVARNLMSEDVQLVARFAEAFPPHRRDDNLQAQRTHVLASASALPKPEPAAVHVGRCDGAPSCSSSDHMHVDVDHSANIEHQPAAHAQTPPSSSNPAAACSSTSTSTSNSTDSRVTMQAERSSTLKRIVAFGQFTGSLLYAAAKTGMRAWSGSLQLVFAELLLATHIILMVCEYNTSQLCVFDALFGDHGGDPERARMTRLYRVYPDGSRRWEREFYCSHCGRVWHRDVHAALAIRVNLLWLLKYGCYHPFYRPPWLRGKDGRVLGAGPDGKPDFHQRAINPNSNAHG